MISWERSLVKKGIQQTCWFFIIYPEWKFKGAEKIPRYVTYRKISQMVTLQIADIIIPRKWKASKNERDSN